MRKIPWKSAELERLAMDTMSAGWAFFLLGGLAFVVGDGAFAGAAMLTTLLALLITFTLASVDEFSEPPPR